MTATLQDVPGETLQSASCGVTILIPCLNEQDTIAECVASGVDTLRESGLSGEVLVVDNGSTDGSAETASAAGARVVREPRRGYGAALMAGIAAANGAYVVMGDADGSYDLCAVPQFVEKLESGLDIVQGCRFESGGGSISDDAMPVLHKWLGNPLLTLLARGMFRVPVKDVYCGLRGFRRDYVRGLGLRCTGMEFATEMLIKATLSGASIGEVPITLHKDRRKRNRSHLRTFRDGSRTLRTYLLYSPKWLFFVPGALMVAAGFLGYALVYSNAVLWGAHLDAHTLMFASLSFLLGVEAIVFAILAKIFAATDGLLPWDRYTKALLRVVTPENAIVASALPTIAGLLLLGFSVHRWFSVHFGNLDYRSTMRWVIPGFTLTAFGVELAFAGSFGALLLLGRRAD